MNRSQLPKGFTIRKRIGTNNESIYSLQYTFQLNGKREYVYGDTVEECYQKADSVKSFALQSLVSGTTKKRSMESIDVDLLKAEMDKMGINSSRLARMTGIANSTITLLTTRGTASAKLMRKIEAIFDCPKGYFDAVTQEEISVVSEDERTNDINADVQIQILKELERVNECLTGLFVVVKEGFATINTGVLKNRSEIERCTEKLNTLAEKWS